MSKSGFDALSSFLKKRYKLVLVLWIIALIIAGSQIGAFFGAVNYNVAGSNFGGPTNSESQQAQNIIDSQFPSTNNSGGNSIILVLQNDQMYSASTQSAIIGLNHSLATDPVLAGNFAGMNSLYSTEYSFLTSVAPALVAQVSQLNASLASSAAGASSNSSSTWDAAASIVANGTAASFASSPLFTARISSLASLLSSFSTGDAPSQVRAGIENAVTHESYLQYPLVLSRSLTKNFISPDNGTMIVIYNFANAPTDKMISDFKSDVSGSNVPALGTYYITGGPVLTSDISKVFGPVLEVTVVPGVLASLAIVGLLLLAPLAAILPVVIGGIAIAIALPVIYYGVVDVGHGTLTFLTPSLTILLVLGLGVDYSVLQLRRTREERAKGSTTEESVAISVRWAGQAVLTAGITVVVAYIVMAVANVPLFSGVGTAIAIAVAILIAAALTLLPSLELLLKDRLFWPGLNRRKNVKSPKNSRLRRLGERTLRRKVAVVVIVAALASGGFYVALVTPSGADILKLFPNFPSNQGLTVLTDNLGSATTDPTTVVVTTPTPILYGNDQFNQTLMNQLEAITSTVTSVDGVVSADGPTTPYGSPFNYTGLQQLGQPEKSQYLAGVLSFVGLNNKTAVIEVGLSTGGQSQAAINTLLRVESAVAKLPLIKGVSVYYGGTTQSTYDNQAFLNGILPEVVVVLAAAIYVILLVQLRSAFTPLRLVITILSSVAFSLALLSIVYFYVQNLPILDFAPLFVVVTMLGVGIDYDIFFVTRIREEAMKGKSDSEAIKTALNKTWVTIFGLGLVLATVFASFVATGISLLGEIGFVVAAAVLIDVGVVILFFVPALMGIAERFNWWPSKLAKRQIRPEGSEADD